MWNKGIACPLTFCFTWSEVGGGRGQFGQGIRSFFRGGVPPLLGHRCRKVRLQVPPVLGVAESGAPGRDDDLYADYGGGSNCERVVFVAANSDTTSAVAMQTSDDKQQQD